ncbi:hypothetical protein AX17_003633 [Amanita inopinata Kibby_2008]|nr:hypothetical protein AX17_003633 [Amanita inopinata Kibby_2008]
MQTNIWESHIFPLPVAVGGQKPEERLYWRIKNTDALLKRAPAKTYLVLNNYVATSVGIGFRVKDPKSNAKLASNPESRKQWALFALDDKHMQYLGVLKQHQTGLNTGKQVSRADTTTLRPSLILPDHSRIQISGIDYAFLDPKSYIVPTDEILRMFGSPLTTGPFPNNFNPDYDITDLPNNLYVMIPGSPHKGCKDKNDDPMDNEDTKKYIDPEHDYIRLTDRHDGKTVYTKILHEIGLTRDEAPFMSVKLFEELKSTQDAKFKVGQRLPVRDFQGRPDWINITENMASQKYWNKIWDNTAHLHDRRPAGYFSHPEITLYIEPRNSGNNICPETLKSIFKGVSGFVDAKGRKKYAQRWEIMSNDQLSRIGKDYIKIGDSPFDDYGTYVERDVMVDYLSCHPEDSNNRSLPGKEAVMNVQRKLMNSGPDNVAPGKSGDRVQAMRKAARNKTNLPNKCCQTAQRRSSSTFGLSNQYPRDMYPDDPDQKTVVQVSAMDVAKEYKWKGDSGKIEKGTRKLNWPATATLSEWLHKSASSFGGPIGGAHSASQVSENFMFGTSETHGVMARYETCFQELLKKQQELDVWRGRPGTNPKFVLTTTNTPDNSNIEYFEVADNALKSVVLKKSGVTDPDKDFWSIYQSAKWMSYVLRCKIDFNTAYNGSWLCHKAPYTFDFFPFQRRFYTSLEASVDDVLLEYLKLRAAYYERVLPDGYGCNGEMDLVNKAIEYLRFKVAEESSTEVVELPTPGSKPQLPSGPIELPMPAPGPKPPQPQTPSRPIELPTPGPKPPRPQTPSCPVELPMPAPGPKPPQPQHPHGPTELPTPAPKPPQPQYPSGPIEPPAPGPKPPPPQLPSGPMGLPVPAPGPKPPQPQIPSGPTELPMPAPGPKPPQPQHPGCPTELPTAEPCPKPPQPQAPHGPIELPTPLPTPGPKPPQPHGPTELPTPEPCPKPPQPRTPNS